MWGSSKAPFLSPMPFSILMKPLEKVMWCFELGGHQFMDDAQLYFMVTSDPMEAVHP